MRNKDKNRVTEVAVTLERVETATQQLARISASMQPLLSQSARIGLTIERMSAFSEVAALRSSIEELTRPLREVREFQRVMEPIQLSPRALAALNEIRRVTESVVTPKAWWSIQLSERMGRMLQVLEMGEAYRSVTDNLAQSTLLARSALVADAWRIEQHPLALRLGAEYPIDGTLTRLEMLDHLEAKDALAAETWMPIVEAQAEQEIQLLSAFDVDDPLPEAPIAAPFTAFSEEVLTRAEREALAGVLSRLRSVEPDRMAQLAGSLRRLMESVLRRLAPDEEAAAFCCALPDAESRGLVCRKRGRFEPTWNGRVAFVLRAEIEIVRDLIVFEWARAAKLYSVLSEIMHNGARDDAVAAAQLVERLDNLLRLVLLRSQ